MDTMTFTLILVRTIAISIVCIVLIIGGCTVNEDYLISRDINAGANPIAASCAHSGSPNEVRCALMAASP